MVEGVGWNLKTSGQNCIFRFSGPVLLLSLEFSMVRYIGLWFMEYWGYAHVGKGVQRRDYMEASEVLGLGATMY